MSQDYETTSRARYSTKTIQYDEDGPGLYTILVTRLELPEGHAMTKKGYRSGHFLYTVINSEPHRTYHNFLQVSERLTAADDPHLFDLLKGIENGWWMSVEDSERFTPEKIENFD